MADVGRITELWRAAADALELHPDPQRMAKLDALVRAEHAEAECARLQEQLDAAQREIESQMQSKLDAQVTLKAVTEALDLRFNELGDGWRDAAPKILARIEEIVDEADRAFRERDAARAFLDAARLDDIAKFLRRRAQSLVEGFYPDWQHVEWLRTSADALEALAAARAVLGVVGEQE